MVLVLSTCTKFGENIHVSGKVVNPATGGGITNVKIELQKKTTFEFSTGFKAVETVYTNANGEFEIRHLGGLKQYYVRCQYSSDYYPLGWLEDGQLKESDFIKIKKVKKVNVVYQMFLIDLKKKSNVNCINSQDYIEIWENI